MRFLLQRPLPDELLSSALVRTCVRFDVSIKALMRSIHGHGNAPSFFHMSNIGAYAEALCMEPRSLLFKATVFPSLVAFRSWERREGYAAEAIQSCPGSLFKLSALQSTSIYVPYRRVCSRCIRSDYATHGWTYWHVSHHLPGVSICQKHNVRLRVTALSTASGSARWSYLLPGGVEVSLKRRRRSDFEMELNRLAWATQAGEPWFTLGQLSERHYRRQLESYGFVDRDRQVSTLTATKWVTGLVSRLPSTKGLFEDDPSLAWIEPVLRYPSSLPQPAFKHLVMHAAIASAPQPGLPFLNHKPTGMTFRDLGALDATAARKLDERIRTAKRRGTRFTLQQLLEEQGIWTTFRHARSRFPATLAVIARYRPALLRARRRPGDRFPQA